MRGFIISTPFASGSSDAPLGPRRDGCAAAAARAGTEASATAGGEDRRSRGSADAELQARPSARRGCWRLLRCGWCHGTCLAQLCHWQGSGRPSCPSCRCSLRGGGCGCTPRCPAASPAGTSIELLQVHCQQWWNDHDKLRALEKQTSAPKVCARVGTPLQLDDRLH